MNNKEDFAPQQQVQPRLFASPLQHQQMVPQQQPQPQPQPQQPIVYSQPQVPVQQQQPQQPLIQQMYYSPSQMYPSIQENSYPVRAVVPDGPLLASQSILQHEESVSFMLFALGFACNLIWLVSFLKYKSSPSPMARKYAKWSRNAFIITALLVVISTILWFGLVLASGRMLVRGGHRHHHHPTPGEGEHPHEPHEPGRPDDHRKPGDHPRHPEKPHPDQPDQPANPEDHRKPEDRPAHPHEKPTPEQNSISYLNGGLLENIRMAKTPEDRMQLFQNMINRVKEQGDLLAVPETAELQVKDLPLMAGKKE